MSRGSTILRAFTALHAPGYVRPKDNIMSHMAGCTAASFSSMKPRICGASCATSGALKASGALQKAASLSAMACLWH